MRSAERFVLDSYALLAYLEDEPGAAAVRGILAACSTEEATAWLSVVNLGEVLYITEREQGLPAAHKAVAAIDQLPVRVAVADRARTFAAAHVKARHPLSFADAFAVALAQEVEGSVVTGDPEFEAVEGLVAVRWIGERDPSRS